MSEMTRVILEWHVFSTGLHHSLECAVLFFATGENCSTDNFGRAIWCSVEVVPLLVALSNKRNKREKKNSLNFDENWRNNMITDAELEQSCKGDKGHQSDYCKIILHFNTSTHIS